MDIKINYKYCNRLNIKNNEFANVEEIFGEIYLDDYEDDFTEKGLIKIGELELHLYNYCFDDYGLNVFNAFDRSINTFSVGAAILNIKTGYLNSKIENKIGYSFNSNILVIHDFKLFPQYRNKGYGKKIISGIEMFFSGKCGIIALKSFPLQHDISLKETNSYTEYNLDSLNKDFKKSQVSLNTFYKKCGFLKVNSKENIFIKNIDLFD